MPNLYVGKPISVLRKTTNGPWKWTAARVVSINNATSVTVSTPQGVMLNGGAAMSMKTAKGQTNVWKHH